MRCLHVKGDLFCLNGIADSGVLLFVFWLLVNSVSHAKYSTLFLASLIASHRYTLSKNLET